MLNGNQTQNDTEQTESRTRDLGAFTPPSEADWCPSCQRHRIDCTHQADADCLVIDGGDGRVLSTEGDR